MRILIIGSLFRIERIAQIISLHFCDIETQPYIYKPDNLHHLEQVFREGKFCYDAILFTGVVPYQMALSIYSPTKPWAYMRRDERQLMKALLRARAADWNISTVSLDSYDQREVNRLYKGIGIVPESLQVKLWQGSIFNAHYISECADFHVKNIKSGSAGAITGSYPVYQRLNKMGLPAIPLEFDDTAVVQAVESLQLRHLSDLSCAMTQVVCRLFIREIGAISVLGESDRHMSYQSSSIIEKVYFFANKHAAAVYDLGGKQFYLTMLLPAKSTDDYQEIVDELLLVTQNHMLLAAIGVGFGENARNAKACAEIAYQEALKQGTHCAFVSHEVNHVHGPYIQMADLATDAEIAYKDAMFSDLAYQTGISAELLSELKNLYLSVDHLTTKEIMGKTGFSLRKVNRLLAKLEAVHAVRIVGTKLNGMRGRPLRVIQILY